MAKIRGYLKLPCYYFLQALESSLSFGKENLGEVFTPLGELKTTNKKSDSPVIRILLFLVRCPYTAYGEVGLASTLRDCTR